MTVWGEIVRGFRFRRGLSQVEVAGLLGVSQRTISRWERGEDNPSLTQQRRLRDLGWEPPGSLLRNLALAVVHCPAPRALTRTDRLQLQLVSDAAVLKRPSITAWIGRDLVDIASGVLQEMLDDRCLQRAIARREIAGVSATTHSVLETAEAVRVQTFRTTIAYFFHDGTLYGDAISLPAAPGEVCGYMALPMDDGRIDRLAGPAMAGAGPPPASLRPSRIAAE